MNEGINLDDGFSELTNRLAELLGTDWLEQAAALASLEEVSLRCRRSVDGELFVRAVRAFLLKVAGPQADRDRTDRALRLRFGSVALVVRALASIAGGDNVLRELRDLVRAWQFERFLDKLFEAEAALYWMNGGSASRICFPEEAHPDFWSDLAAGPCVFRFPNECKRIEPRDPAGRALDAIAEAVEAHIRAKHGSASPIKLTLWTHRADSAIAIDRLAAELDELVAQATRNVASSAWRTCSDPSGAYQLSIALAPEFGELVSRRIDLPDIPSVPIVRVCAESTYLGTPLDPVRLKYALSVRSDRLPRRIGAFERNLRKAVEQLRQSEGGLPGIAHIRLRPPRELGDLYEADAIARRVLQSEAGQHVALVCLYWNESERTEGQQVATDAGPGREVTEYWHLRAHFVAGRGQPVDFSPIDSAAERFPQADGRFIRDPSSGALTPVPLDFWDLLANPMELEELDATLDAEGRDAATIYFELTSPLDGDLRAPVRCFRVAEKPFVAMFAGDLTFRVIEFHGDAPRRQATIDLRTWRGETEFIFTIRNASGNWLLTAGHADGQTEARAVSCAIPGAFHLATSNGRDHESST